jgi:IclR family acetate operon transcriptional repressor
MQRELARVRRRGYAINDEEWCMGLPAVAAPIFGSRGDVVASICIGGPTAKMTDAKLEKYGTMVRDAGMDISNQLGSRRPHTWGSVK